MEAYFDIQMENINKPSLQRFHMMYYLSLIKDSVVVEKMKNKRKEGGMIEGRKRRRRKERELETELAGLESTTESQLYDLN